jgi:two-component system sensor histidine kinase CpxA
MRSLFLKIFLWFWLAMVLVVVATAVMFAIRRETAISHWRATMGNAMGLYAQKAAHDYEEHGDTALRDNLRGIDANAEVHAAMLDATGAPLLPPRGSHTPRELVQQALASDQLAFTMIGPDGYGAQRVTSPSGRKYVLVVHIPPQALGFRLSPGKQAVRLALLAILFSGPICYGLARYLARPVLQLRTAARRLAAGDLTARASLASGRRDEIGELVQDFNRMAARIEALVSSQRQLISDISHELRSPLARLNVALGLARQRSGPEAAAPLERIEREADRLNELIGKLLALARMEAASTLPDHIPVDIYELLAEIVADAEFEAQEKGSSVKLLPLEPPPANAGSPPAGAQAAAGAQTSGGQPAAHAARPVAQGKAVPDGRTPRIRGSAELLGSAFENVIRNAVRYTAPSTPVEVSLACAGGWVTVKVRDHGPGVPELELQNLFRAFYRVAGARDRQSGGAGLGLAIAERAVCLHGGSISATLPHDGPGLQIEIRLPLAGSQEPGAGR